MLAVAAKAGQAERITIVRTMFHGLAERAADQDGALHPHEPGAAGLLALAGLAAGRRRRR